MELNRIFNSRLVLLLLMHAIHFLPCPSTNNTTDHLALLAFKASISGGPSGILSSWNTSLPFCSWRGVTCGRQHPDRVTALDLHSMNLSGTISPSITNLTFLRGLHLADNSLGGPIPYDLGHLSRLEFLNLSYNSLSGEIPASLTRCSKLQYLLLGANQLEGRIPAGLSNCTELQIISLRANRLHGGVPVELTTLPKLVRLILGTNNLGGSILPSLGNLTTLSILDLAENKLVGGIPDTLGRITGLGALQICINQLTGSIPPCIYNLSSIWHFHVAVNQLVGTLPPDMGRSFPKLQFLFMYENEFEGPIPASLSNASGLIKIELAANRFSGRVPPELGVLRNLVEVLLASNRLEDGEAYGWSFLNSLTNCSNLQIIDLYDNRLQGKFPESISNLSTTLWKLSMNNNQITGSILDGIGNLVGLTSLNLEYNLLTGTIPATIGKLQRLHIMNLSANKLSGQLTSSIGNLTLLTRLTLDGCELVGSIPTSIGNLHNLELLDLSSNKLSGSIPKELVSLSSLSRYLSLSNNSLYGSLPVEVGNLKNLELLDVSMNNLSGEIPSTLGQCQIMVYLYMGDNDFEGRIPQSLSNLKGLQELDLSSNKLSGNIPEFLQGLQYLQNLNLSFNNFEGKVPTGGVFQNASAVSLQENGELCGGSPGMKLHACITQPSRRRHRFLTRTTIISVTSAVICLILLLALIYARHKPQKPREGDASMESLMDHQYVKISYSELRKATDGFSSVNLIGVGSFGSVYKGIMDAGNVVAVKVLDLQQQGASKSFMAECQALKNIRHRNLNKILTACSSVDFKGDEFKALVFEFMPNGSLDEWLHSESRSLSFIKRLNIAIDVASALNYLHHHGQTPIVHCDLKPSNVLLDNDMNAHVGDFGLARFLTRTASKSSGNSSSSIGIKGTIGYVAPEYGMGSQASIHGDVYSYGILLLEMFTGKRPTDDIFKDGLSLRRYAETYFPEDVIEITDRRLLFEGEDGGANDQSVENTRNSREKMQECLVSIIGLGLSSSKELPRERKDLNEVLNEMHAVRNAFLGD